ncbi:MAG: ATP-binding protein [Sedimenticola sp.]|nr:ATP-binding protein [Sedimenticola sp.]
MNQTISIRKRLLVTLSALIGITWLGIFVLVNQDATHELEEIYDASLAQNARILFGLLQKEIEEGEVEMIRDIALSTDYLHDYELNIAFWAKFGKIIIQSRDAPEFLTELPEGFSNYIFDNNKWRVFTLRDSETGLLIHTAQKLQAREELVSYLIKDTLSVLLLVLPILGLLIWWGISSSLKPLRQLVDEAGAMNPQSLQPFNTADSPKEIAPLITALNRLLERLNLAIDNERRFTSDAAHELRTPLAGLKVQLQVAQRAENLQQKNTAINKALEGIDRTTHLVNQLLTLARADREDKATLKFEPVDLAFLCQIILGSMESEATKHGAILSLNFDEKVSFIVVGEPTMIQIALRNLLENAIHYSTTPARAGIDLTLSDKGDKAVIRVWDTGKGIPQDAIDQMFQRFKRGEQNRYNGSGLGLSIVKRVCEIHDADISVTPATETSEFSMTLSFKLAPNIHQ